MSFYTDNRAELETLAPLLRRIATGEATEEEKQQALDSPLASRIDVAQQIHHAKRLGKMQLAMDDMNDLAEWVKSHLEEAGKL